MHKNLGYRRRDAAREPITIPRWALSLKYLGFVALGVATSFAGVPSLQEATWRAYTIYWAAALTVVAVFAALGSLRAEWEAIEKWGAVGISSILSAYTFASIVITSHMFETGDPGAPGRVAFTIILGIINMLPIGRSISLLRRTGMHR